LKFKTDKIMWQLVSMIVFMIILIQDISKSSSFLTFPSKLCRVPIVKFSLLMNNKESDVDKLTFQPKTNEAPVVSDKVEGYLSPDFSTIGDGKQIRVLLYIGLALIPCLALVPFFLSREFVPPIDTDYSINVIKNTN